MKTWLYHVDFGEVITTTVQFLAAEAYVVSIKYREGPKATSYRLTSSCSFVLREVISTAKPDAGLHGST